MGNNRRGFTLVELLVGIMIMGIMMGVATLGVSSFTQSTKREAENVAFYLQTRLAKSNSQRANFKAIIEGNAIKISWDKDKEPSESIRASGGLTYETNCNNNNKIFAYEKRYDISTTSDTPQSGKKYISVKGNKQSDYYYVLIGE